MALVWGADRFVEGAASTARNLGVSPLVIGLTIVGFGTSAPEMLVSTVAACTGNSGIAVGNAIGSNITNVTLVLGVAALVRPLEVHSKIIRRELPLLLLVMGGALLLVLDGRLGRIDGVLLLCGLVVLMTWVVRQGLADRKDGADPLSVEYEEGLPAAMSTGRGVAWVVVGLGALLGSSRALVWGAVALARHFGVSDLVIGLTVVAVGTSLPELAASVTAAVKNEHDIAVGNVIGSNMFNLLGVLGLPGVIAPGKLDPAVLDRDFPVMIGLTVLLFLLSRGFGARGRLSRWKGGLLAASFVGYLVLLFGCTPVSATHASPPPLSSRGAPDPAGHSLRSQPSRFARGDGRHRQVGSPKTPTLALGATHSCLLKLDGSVWCWGSNRFGQLGQGQDAPHGPTAMHTRPVQVPGVSDAVALAAGLFHTCAVRRDGRVLCWGHGGWGLLGDGKVGGPDVLAPGLVSGVTDVRAISAGEGFTCALTSSGRVMCWGRDDHGQLGRGNVTLAGPPAPVAGIDDATGVAAGRSQACALCHDGQLWCWGFAIEGQVGPAARADDVPSPVRVPLAGTPVELAGGGYHDCVRFADGRVACFGSDDSGQLGTGGGGAPHDRRARPAPMTGIADARSIALGARFTCVLRAGGTVACAGYDGRGQLGDGTTRLSKTAVVVTGIEHAVAIGAGAAHACALNASGTILCWGDDTWGQLGDGSTVDRRSPVEALGPVSP